MGMLSKMQRRAQKGSAARPPTLISPIAIAAARPKLAEERRPYEAKETGLKLLRRTARINPREHRAGEHYGAVYRVGDLRDGQSLKSCLDIRPRGSGSPNPSTAWDEAEWIAYSGAELARARALLNYHSGMVAACDLICGHHMRPREIDTSQRGADEIVNGLRIALQILVADGFGSDHGLISNT